MSHTTVVTDSSFLEMPSEIAARLSPLAGPSLLIVALWLALTFVAPGPLQPSDLPDWHGNVAVSSSL